MMFWCSGSGITFDYPRKLIPCGERPRGGASEWMIDSGVKLDEPVTIEKLLDWQEQYADVAVCPDILGDPEATAERTAEWLPEIRRRKPQAVTVLCTQGTIPERVWLMDQFPAADWIGMGLFLKAPGVVYEDEERERILRLLVPEIHSRGKRCHIFGIGCTARHLRTMRELRVNSFDSSAPLRAAITGHVFDTALRQVHIGGRDDADTKRLRVYLNLSQIQRAIEHGPQEQADRLGQGFEHITGQGKLFDREDQACSS